MITATRQNAFTIPFRIEPTQSPADQPVEVQLHVSMDRGASWQLAARVKPEKSSFVYRAPHDGEYWYSIRTVDRQGVARPQDPLQPQLIVTVDTVAPRLEVSVVRGAAGELMARWQAVDPNLKPDSFKLEYQVGSAGSWERVAVDAPADSKRHTLTGETTWWPRTTAGPISVRGEITDTAGNPAVSQALVRAADVADNRTAGDSTHWPADRASSEPPAQSATAQRAQEQSADPSWRGTDAQGRASRRVPAQTIGHPARSLSPLDFSVLPSGERPRMVNSRSFELEYDIDSIGPSGIAKVELWGTRDGGRHWTSFGLDPDRRSPVAVTVDGEGIYGFRIVVQSGSGLGAQAPVDGDLPEIWIGVDLTKPTGRITGTETGADAGELVIRWEANDDVPDPRPVNLSFSGAAHGPWTPIASGLDNTGEYRWRLDERVPERFYLRLEVRDEAGNVGSFEKPEPISIDRTRPEGHIRGVRPIGQAASDKAVR